MVYCPKCGKEVVTEWTHCPYCGANLTQVFQQLPYEKKKDRRKVIAAIVGLSGFLGAGYLAYRYFGDEIMAIIERLMEEGNQATTTTRTTTTTFTTGTTGVSSSPSPTTHLTTSETTTTAFSTTASSFTSPTTTSAAITQTMVTPIPEFPKRDWDRLAYPYIWVGGQAYYDEVQTCVENRGDAPSFYTIVELYQGPVPNRSPGLKFIEHPLNSFKLTWRKIVTLTPGQRLDFNLSEVTPRNEVLVWVCYDPLLDPRRFRMDSDLQLRSIFRNGLNRDRHIMVMGRSGVVED